MRPIDYKDKKLLYDLGLLYEPLKRGHWRYDQEVGYYVCSECGQEGDTDFIYCPWCGTNMYTADTK